MYRKFAARGDSQTDYEFLRKDYESMNIDPRENQDEFISTEEVVQLYAAIIVEVVFQTSTSQVCFGKVKIEHLVDSLKRGGVLTDP